ncbi:MAG: phosphoenolpyruvate carboxylase [Cyanobacteria bacterium P01_G01_bin.38]
MSNSSQNPTVLANEESLKTLARAIELSRGEFSLNLVKCNYAHLREQMVEKLKELCSIQIYELHLQESSGSLYTEIQKELSEQHPQALMIFGLESVTDIDKLLISTNQIREEFRRELDFPLILWVNDSLLKKMSKIAPDFKSWAAIPIEFSISIDELDACLKRSIDKVFNAILSLGDSRFLKTVTLNQPLDFRHAKELDFAASDFLSSNAPLSRDLEASLFFLQGQVRDIFGERANARQFYENSLKIWNESVKDEKSTAAIQRLSCVAFYLGLWWRQYVSPHRADYQIACRKAKNYFHQCVRELQQAQYDELAAKFVNAWGEVLVQLNEQTVDELQEIAQTAIDLHQKHHEPVRLAYGYGLMAEVAIRSSNWKTAKHYAELALATNSMPSKPNVDLEWERQHYESFYLLLLAEAQYHLNQTSEAIDNLNKAKTSSNPQYDPLLYIRILDVLRQVYFAQKEYLKAFNIKEFSQAIKQQYGFLAFIGAGRLRPSKTVFDPISAVAKKDERIAKEIIASGRQQKVQDLIRRIMDRTDCRLTILYGPSGVGKSSIIQAGLVPVLSSSSLDTRNLTIITLQIYTNWIEDLGQHLVKSIQKVPNVSVPDRPLISTLDILRQLQENTLNRNLVTILVLDQFEEFFFACQDPDQRKQFYEFLDACLEIDYVKVFLAIREDYLHRILECNDRLVNLKKINNILHKDILFFLENLTTEDAKSVIQALTEDTQLSMEPKLVNRVVKDLAGEYGQVLPIELQVLGTQLQVEKISTLQTYLDKGSKDQIVNRFLEEVVKDCGDVNEQVARLVLYLLTDENNTRPIKTHTELAQDLEALGVIFNLETLRLILMILVGSGIVLRLLEASADRYQLVHDYLVPLIRHQENLDLRQKLTEARLEQQLTEQEVKNAKKQAEELLLEVKQRESQLLQEQMQFEQERKKSEQKRKQALEVLLRQVPKQSEQVVGEAITEEALQSLSTEPFFLNHPLKFIEDSVNSVVALECGSEILNSMVRLRSIYSQKNKELEESTLDVLKVVEELSLEEMIRLIRALILYFHIVNIVEQCFEKRIRQQYKTSLKENTFRSGTINEGNEISAQFQVLFPKLRGLNVPPQKVQRVLDRLDVQLVFTSHPTEIFRYTIRDKQRKTVEILRKIDRAEEKLMNKSSLSSTEVKNLREHFINELTLWWRTDELHQFKPHVLDEVDFTLHYFQDVLFDVIPSLYQRFHQALKDNYRNMRLPKRNFCRLGSWVGADQDGNPSVSPEITWKAACHQRNLVLRKYIDSVRKLTGLLSPSLHWSEVFSAILESLEEDRLVLPDVYEQYSIRYRQEPYRLKLVFIEHRLINTYERSQKLHEIIYTQAENLVETSPQFYSSAEEFLAELYLIQQSLEGTGLVCQQLNDLICQVEVFGFSFAHLDIKQNCSVHTNAVDEIIGYLKLSPRRYNELTEEERVLWLVTELKSLRPLGALMLPLSKKTNERLQTFRMIAALQKEFGLGICQKYIISQCNRASHVLEALLLAKEASLYNPATEHSAIQVVPSFETLEDLNLATKVMSTLFDLPLYQTFLEKEGKDPYQEEPIFIQELLVSYSETNKDIGFLSSNWEIHKAQYSLQKMAEKHGIFLRILYEKGGSIGRGGGLIHETILAQPGKVIDGRIKITEQGEDLAAKYLLPEVALSNLEGVASAVLQLSLLPSGYDEIQPWNEIMTELSARASSAYRDLVYEQPGFVDFFYRVTPFDEISQLQISSRPKFGKSRSGKTAELGTIPWMFSWNQSRFSLQSWYGVGTALQGFLEKAPDEHIKLLRSFYHKWPFFHMVVSKCEMALAKVNLRIAHHYLQQLSQPEDQKRFEAIFEQIVSEYNLTRDLILLITSHEQLLDDNPDLQRSLQFREETIAPLGFLQVELVKRFREHRDVAVSLGRRESRYSRGELLRGTLFSIDAIAAGLQETG